MKRSDVVLSEHCVSEGAPRLVFKRSLLFRLTRGRLNDVESALEPAIMELEDGTVIMHPKLWEELKGEFK